jgi:hypothetical protein
MRPEPSLCQTGKPDVECALIVPVWRLCRVSSAHGARLSSPPGWGHFLLTFLGESLSYEINSDNCSAAVLSKRIRAGFSKGLQQAAGAGETEGACWLQTTGYSRRYETVGRRLCCERAETKRSGWANRCAFASRREEVVVERTLV